MTKRWPNRWSSSATRRMMKKRRTKSTRSAAGSHWSHYLSVWSDSCRPARYTHYSSGRCLHRLTWTRVLSTRGYCSSASRPAGWSWSWSSCDWPCALKSRDWLRLCPTRCWNAIEWRRCPKWRGRRCKRCRRCTNGLCCCRSSCFPCASTHQAVRKCCSVWEDFERY